MNSFLNLMKQIATMIWTIFLLNIKYVEKTLATSYHSPVKPTSCVFSFSGTHSKRSFFTWRTRKVHDKNFYFHFFEPERGDQSRSCPGIWANSFQLFSNSWVMKKARRTPGIGVWKLFFTTWPISPLHQSSEPSPISLGESKIKA